MVEPSYNDYRKDMEKIVFLRNKLVFVMSEKKRLNTEYKKAVTDEKNLRNQLISLIPSKF
jgi:hypothetical protein